MTTKLLIANRGEIVLRIIRACLDLGIKTVAVYSEADVDAMYLKMADETYCIGPSNPLKSYLNIEAIIDVLKKSGADAVHPGYGFLSENASFAEAVVACGAKWIGPPPQVLRAIESKSYCRKIAAGAGVPVVPGTLDIIDGIDDIDRFVTAHGFPIVLKLDRGGGGKGIENVTEEAEVKVAYERLTRVGMFAFKSPDCYIEKEVVKPRHIEIQFIADHDHHCVCLGERECSIQRRFQKIIEESPSMIVTEEERANLFNYTVRLVRAMDYRGAGTMEFLRSQEGDFYFMEVNARLQVEHPVTEFVTGIDIVKAQIDIARGKELPFRQDDVEFRGHAIEARVYAEDPITFAPSPGTIKNLRLPEEDGKSLRIDHAIEDGAIVPPYYDPMLAKVIAWGETREEAVDRLKTALLDFQIEGIMTTNLLNLHILDSKRFLNGEINTSFIRDLLKRRKLTGVK